MTRRQTLGFSKFCTDGGRATLGTINVGQRVMNARDTGLPLLDAFLCC